MQRALYLVPLQQGSVQPFACKHNDTVQIGRTKANGLPASVSRAAIDATAKLESGLTVLHIAIRSTVYLRKSADLSKVTAHKAGEQLTLGIGDQLFLGKAEDANGFVVQVSNRNRVNSSSTAAEQPAKRPRLASGQSAASTAAMQRSASGGGSRSASPAEAAPAAGPLSGLHLVFWRLKHARPLIDKAQRQGAVVEEAFTPATDFAIVEPLTQTSQLLQELAEYDRSLLPQSLRFVTRDFLTDTFSAGKLQDATSYVVDHKRPTDRVCSSTPEPEPQPAAAAGAGASAAADSSTAAAASAVLGPPQPATGAAAQPAAAAAAGQSPATSGRVEAGAFTDAGPHVPRHRRFTGGDVQASRPWGTGGVWLEPYDRQSANASVKKLFDAWHQSPTDLQRQAGEARSGEASDAGNAAGAGAAQAAAATTNGICEHVACSACGVCIVKELEETRRLYRSRTDQFRIKAVQKGITVLSTWPRPVRDPSDVADLNVGAKTREKILEIMETGRLERNAVRSADPAWQAKQMFASVWGCGDIVAAKWYHEGCRTLDDVRKRTDLTMQQQVGLKYYDDLQQRIPREEAAEFERVVRAATAEALKLHDPDAERLFAYLLGSFCRGKTETGDVDVVIIVPEVRQDKAASEVHLAVRQKLLDKGILADEMHVRAVHGVSHAASWCGIGRLSPDKPFRRVDIKVWAFCLEATAINHFIGSGPFARALRYWAHYHISPAAAEQCEKDDEGRCMARGFKLSELGLQPIKAHRQAAAGYTLRDADFDLVGSPLPVRNETDIFAAIGLAYVPPFMRVF